MAQLAALVGKEAAKAIAWALAAKALSAAAKAAQAQAKK